MIDLLPVLMTATRTIPQQMTEWFGVPLPDELLAELGIRVGDSLYLAEEYVGTTGCLVLTKTPQALLGPVCWSSTRIRRIRKMSEPTGNASTECNSTSRCVAQCFLTFESG